jgi:hypothetical protein
MAGVIERPRSVPCELHTEAHRETYGELRSKSHARPHYELHAELQSTELAAPTHDPSRPSEARPSSVPAIDIGPLRLSSQRPDTETSSSVEHTTANISVEPPSALDIRDDRQPPTAQLQTSQLLDHQDTSTSNPITSTTPSLTYSLAQKPKPSSWKRLWTSTVRRDNQHSSFSRPSRSTASTLSLHRYSTVPSVDSRLHPASSSAVSSSTPTSSVVFSIASLTSTRTSVDADTIFLPISSPKMYLFCEKTSLYVGKLRELSLPLETEAEWRQDTWPRLLGDLRCVLQTLPARSRKKTVIEPELRLLGEPDETTGLVELHPTVLIRCGCESYRIAIDKAVRDLGYLQSFSKGRVLVHRKAPTQASRSSVAIDLGSASCTPHNVDDATDIVELAVSDTSSACGLRMRYTRHSIVTPQSLCTIGGLIKIDDKVYGLTTGHSITMLSEQEDVSNTESDSDSDAKSEIEIDMRSMISPSSTDLESGTGNVSSSLRWIRAQLGPFSYLNRRSHTATNHAYPLSQASDFALVEVGEHVRDFTNTYMPSGQSYGPTRTIDTISTEEPAGPVSIVCSPTDVRSAHLLEGDHGYLDRCAFFATKKLQTVHPLGELSSETLHHLRRLTWA